MMCYYNDMETVPVPLETEVLLQEKNKRKDGPAQAEDLALKSAAAYFGDELIHWLGIQERTPPGSYGDSGTGDPAHVRGLSLRDGKRHVLSL